MSLASEFPKVVIDPTAETTVELFAQWPLSRTRLEKFIHSKVSSGEWERVGKKVGNRVYPAYRKAKRSNK